MDQEPIDETSIAALARAVGLEVPDEDLAPLQEALAVYARATAQLEALQLEPAAIDWTLDPRAGW